MAGLPQLLGRILGLFPPWAVPLVVVVLVALVLPGWLRWVAARQVRGQLRHAFYAREAPERARYVDAAFARTGNKPGLLVVLAEESMKIGMKPTAQRAIAALEEAGGHPHDLQRLRAAISPEASRRAGHPVEEAVIIERMWAEGLHDAARARLAEARSRFPEDPELRALGDRLTEPSEPTHTG